MVQIVKVLWGIWSARNMKIWDNKVVSAELTMQWSDKQISQWKELQHCQVRTGGHTNLRNVIVVPRWTAPVEGRTKINVDASVVIGAGNFAVGMVWRDHQGVFIKGRNMRGYGEVSVLEAETRGVVEALNWILESGAEGVDVECDSMTAVQAIRKGTENYLEVGSLFQDCRTILNSRPDISILFTKKQANKVAHLIARVPCEVHCFTDFLSPPYSVLETLLYDAEVA